MKKLILTLVMFGIANISQTQNILVFTKTSGFNHGTKVKSVAMFQSFDPSYTVVQDDTGAEFDSLHLYDIVVFANTSGNNLLTQARKDSFESYVNKGGATITIHAGAGDTYINSTGGWDWYSENVTGLSVIPGGPNHTANNYNGTMIKVGNPLWLASLPNLWTGPDEYYYNGYYNNKFDVLYRINSTGNQPYDTVRTITHIKGNQFSTTLGHHKAAYNVGTNFYNLIKEATNFLLVGSAFPIFQPENDIEEINIRGYYPNPTEDIVIFQFEGDSKGFYEVYNMNAYIVSSTVNFVDTDSIEINFNNLPRGTYLIKIVHLKPIFGNSFVKIIKQ